MATGWETPHNADVILRASGGKEFHAHKLILSLASTVFRDMFSIPQPPPTESSQLPIIDVDDPPEALEAFLRIIYPTRSPPITDIEGLATVLRLAQKYDARDIVDIHKDHLPSLCNDFSPIEMYAILCACGREEEAGAAARRVPFASLKTLDSNPLLPLITTTQYQRLVSFLTVRDQRTREIVSSHQRRIQQYPQPCYDDTPHRLYSGVIVTSIQAAFEANPCAQVTEALVVVSNSPLAFPPCRDTCKYNLQGIRKYAESLLEELVKMAETLPWKG